MMTTSALSEIFDSLQLSAGGAKVKITDVPSLGLQVQPQLQPQHGSTGAVSAARPEVEAGPVLFERLKEVDTSQQIETIPGPTEFMGSEFSETLEYEEDLATKPPIARVSSREDREDVILERFVEVESIRDPVVFMSSEFREEHVTNPSTTPTSSQEDEGPVFSEHSLEEDREEMLPATYRTPMRARLREDPAHVEVAHPEYGTVIGIDLGTSYSRVGVQRGGKFEIIPNDQGQWATPSRVRFAGNRRLVGDCGKDFKPDNTIFSVKRLVGRKMDDQDMIRDSQNLPFKVKDQNGTPTIVVKLNRRERNITPEEITAAIITKMKETAEAYLGHKVTHAVVTAPACFNDSQRQATKDAGKIAGLDIVRILNEPTAAAISYGLHRKGASRVLVYSLGGGFFDVSLLSIDNGVFEVLATTGDTHLGGEDFDNRVVDYLIKLYKKKTGTDVSQDFLAVVKLKNGVERAKRTLSCEQTARIEIDSFEDGNDFSETISRAKFEELNMHLFNKTIRLVERALRDANCKKEEVDEVLLVGGSTRIPRIQQLLKQYFRKKDLSKDIDPDEATICGAAIQGGILTGSEKVTNIILVDVCPHSRGIEVVGDLFAEIISRNATIPTTRSKIFTTMHDNQIHVRIAVYEGEHSQIKYNNLLGTFTLSGILPAPRGVPQIEVTFDIDASGILHVHAVDKKTGSSGSIAIVTNKGGLSQEQIMRMQAASEGYVTTEHQTKARRSRRSRRTRS